MGRISSLQPDILLVEKTVSRVAQEFLYDAGITLILNVKPVSSGNIRILPNKFWDVILIVFTDVARLQRCVSSFS